MAERMIVLKFDSDDAQARSLTVALAAVTSAVVGDGYEILTDFDGPDNAYAAHAVGGWDPAPVDLQVIETRSA